MAAYYKVEVTLNSQAVQVGLPSPQSVRVTLPLRGPQGLQGVQGEVGPVGPVGQTGSPGADGREVELQTTETHVQWRYEGESAWTNLVALSAITGPQGIQGETGLTGVAGADGREVELRKTQTHVQWRYEDEAEWTDLVALADITGPQGETGQQGIAGPANTLAIGTVTTGAAGSSADATITGDSPAQTLNLVIPRGDKGDTGDQGPAGTATTDAADLTTGTLADARLSSNVPLKDAANTFSANQTLNGTNNVAPNQTAASGSSLMTRSLGEIRYLGLPPFFTGGMLIGMGLAQNATVEWLSPQFAGMTGAQCPDNVVTSFRIPLPDYVAGRNIQLTMYWGPRNLTATTGDIHIRTFMAGDVFAFVTTLQQIEHTANGAVADLKTVVVNFTATSSLPSGIFNHLIIQRRASEANDTWNQGVTFWGCKIELT